MVIFMTVIELEKDPFEVGKLAALVLEGTPPQPPKLSNHVRVVPVVLPRSLFRETLGVPID